VAEQATRWSALLDSVANKAPAEPAKPGSRWGAMLAKVEPVAPAAPEVQRVADPTERDFEAEAARDPLDVGDVSPREQLRGRDLQQAAGEAFLTPGRIAATVVSAPARTAWNIAQGTLEVPDIIPEPEERLVPRGAEGTGYEALRSGVQALAGGAGAGGFAAPAAMIGGALGAAGGRALAEETGADDTEGLVYELIGSLGGGFLPALSRAAGTKVAEGLGSLASRLSSTAIPTTIRRAAAKRVVELIEAEGGDVQGVLRNLASATGRGERGTVSTLTGNPQLRAAERGLRVTHGTADERANVARVLDAENQATRDVAADIVTELAPAGVPAAATKAAKGRVRGALRRTREAQARRGAGAGAMEAQAESIRQGLVQRAQEVPTREQAGAAAVAAEGNVRDVLKGAADAAWKAPEIQAPIIPAASVKEQVSAFLKGLKPLQRRRFSREYATELKDIDSLDGNVSAQDIHDLVRGVREAMTSEVKAGGRAKHLDALATQLTTRLQAAVTSDPRVSDAYEAALAASQKQLQALENAPPLAAARRAARKAGAPGLVGETLTVPGTKGAARVDAARTAEEAAELPGELTGALRKSFLRSFYDAAVPSEGAPSAAKARAWVEKRPEQLKRYPELRDEADVVIASLDESERLGLSAAEARKAAERAARAGRAAVEKMPEYAFSAGGMDAVDAATTALRSKKPVATARRLARTARSAGTEAVEGLKAAYRDALARTVGKGDKPLRASQRAALRQVFDGDEVTRLEQADDLLRRLYARGGTVPDSEFYRRVPAGPAATTAAGLSRLAGAAVASNAPGNQLIMARLGSQATKSALQDIPEAQFRAALFNLLTDPERFAGDIARFAAPDVPPGDVASRAVALVRRLSTPAGAAAALATGE